MSLKGNGNPNSLEWWRFLRLQRGRSDLFESLSFWGKPLTNDWQELVHSGPTSLPLRTVLYAVSETFSCPNYLNILLQINYVAGNVKILTAQKSGKNHNKYVRIHIIDVFNKCKDSLLISYSISPNAPGQDCKMNRGKNRLQAFVKWNCNLWRLCGFFVLVYLDL